MTQPVEPVPDETETLTDIGAAHLALDDGWVAAEAVDADGSRSFWLLDPDVDDDTAHPMPEHELDGPLPDDVWARVWQTPGTRL